MSPGPDSPITTIGDDLVLLSVSAGDGQIGSAGVLGIGLMGAELVLLAASERIDIAKGRINVLDPAPTGDAEADAALASLAAARNPPRAKSWCSRPRRGICGAYLARLQAAGLIRAEQAAVLRFIPVTRWRVTDPARVADARARLDAIATGSGQIDLAQAAFGGLAHAIALSDRLYPGRANRAVHKRLQQVADGDLTAPPDVSAAHHAMSSSVHAASHAAVSAAVHSATHAAVSAAHSAAHSAASGGHGGGGGHH